MSKKTFFSLFVILGLFAGLIFQWPDRKLHLVVCDVGQGDAILLKKGFSQVLVDGGPNDRVLDCLSEQMPFWDRRIELIAATHPDKDHIAGLVDVIERYKVGYFVGINQANETTVFENLREAVFKNQIPVHVAVKGEEIKIGDINLRVLSPEKDSSNFLVWQKDKNSQPILGAAAKSSDTSSNDQSVVLKTSFGEFDALLTGDIGASIERKLAEEYDLSSIEILKVSHHGSKYSTSKELLEAVRPKLALIGVGKNQWGHPAREILERLAEFKIPVLRTDLDGDIEVVSDGEKWWLKN